MLLGLHIKNLALVREIDITFEDGLNILSGETGAGKSILIESIAAALGGRVPKNMVRSDAEYALIELTFLIRDERTRRALTELEIPMEEDGTVLISRKISDKRNTIRIGDETFTAGRLREAAPHLLDIYGQNEHQSLLLPARQLLLIDEYGKETIGPAKAEMAEAYEAWQKAEEALASLSMNEEERLRRIDLISYEVNEIESAALTEGEDAQLEAEYRRLANGQKILTALGEAHEAAGYETGGAGDGIGNAVHALGQIRSLDPSLDSMYESISQIEDILNDFNRELSGYMDSFHYDEASLAEAEERLDLINRLKAKYGRTIETILAQLADRKEQLEALTHHEELLAKAEKEKKRAEQAAKDAAEKLHLFRVKAAKEFSENVAAQLLELNFAQAVFEAELPRKDKISANGFDNAEFMISTNPGEEVRPLRLIASGGELSRIMLGIKAMFAGIQDAGTLIFDEIDTGISGRTAQKVAERLAAVAAGRQVLCITHLPQIAAMADAHFLIEKKVGDHFTESTVRPLCREESVEELARMIGGASVTEQTIRSAEEMKRFSEEFRSGSKQLTAVH